MYDIYIYMIWVFVFGMDSRAEQSEDQRVSSFQAVETPELWEAVKGDDLIAVRDVGRLSCVRVSTQLLAEVQR